MTAKEVCLLLDISSATLNRRIADGDIVPLPKNPAHKQRYRLQFRRSDIEELAATLRVQAGVQIE